MKAYEHMYVCMYETTHVVNGCNGEKPVTRA